MRERGASSALPPLYFLHVWWARRPLIASRAAVLGGMLPAWGADWPPALQSKFPTEAVYRGWFLRLLGIAGDPIAARKLIGLANQNGLKLKGNPYGCPRAFTVSPSGEDLQTLGDLLEYTWGTRELSVLDPFAGGGSIPFEALRYGFTTIANDLNPVAAVILKATLEYPVRFGPSLADDIRHWGDEWARRVKEKLSSYFPKEPGESIFAYLWARTVSCPSTGKPVPLSPNWWLKPGDEPVAVQLLAGDGLDRPQFEIVTGNKVRAASPEIGTIAKGIGRSPWTGETIPGDYIKAEAQAGRMGHMLYAIAYKGPGGLMFRLPSPNDEAGARRAGEQVDLHRINWEVEGIIPTEEISDVSNYDRGHRLYGIYRWADMFAPRQLLAASAYLRTLAEISHEITAAEPGERASAIVTLLAIALDKSLIYNALACRYDPGRGIRSVFDKHNFAFVWSYAEFDASASLLPWVVEQVVDAYRSVATLCSPAQVALGHVASTSLSPPTVTRTSAMALDQIADGTISNITVDPPYYDNVMYSELADFFYVWLKRSVGKLLPDLFMDELTNKDDEAIANPARFAAFGSKKKRLAEQDYERKMAAAFREMYRVLRPDGVLTVMFTHKRVEAWDTLATALIGAGFVIKASWPVHTESEHSLHQAEKNAASSTILLVCRKRQAEEAGDPLWWDDIQGRVRETARAKAHEFAAQGISGVDLYLSTFGPTLSIISERWPVLTSEIDPKTGQPRALRPEMALELAREEVVRLRKQGLLLGREIQFDPVTDWYLMAWADFGAEQFPYDEARKLAIALGVDLDKQIMAQKRLVTKKGKYVVLQMPAQRRKRDRVDDEATAFEHWIDAAHTAMMVYAEDGAGACDAFLRKSGLKGDGTFRGLLQALLNAIPRSRIKGKFVRPEAEVLENMRLAFFDDLVAPVEEEPELPQYVQMGLGAMDNDGKGDDEDGEDQE